MGDTSSQATARSRQQVSSQVITTRILQLINKATRCLMPSHLSRLTMDLMAILNSSSSCRTATVREDTGSKDTTVDTNTARVDKVVGIRLNGECEHET